jgi:hypothetical protein
MGMGMEKRRLFLQIVNDVINNELNKSLVVDEEMLFWNKRSTCLRERATRFSGNIFTLSFGNRDSSLYRAYLRLALCLPIARQLFEHLFVTSE